MTLAIIKERLEKEGIFHSEGTIMQKPSVAGYHKKFRWAWVATQLNTFYVASDFGDEMVTAETMETHISNAFNYAQNHYKGWPRGLQSAIGSVSIIITSNPDPSVIEYCEQLKSGKKWSGFTIPVVIDSSNGKVYRFKSSPMWGRIYYPYFKEMIDRLCN